MIKKLVLGLAICCWSVDAMKADVDCVVEKTNGMSISNVAAGEEKSEIAGLSSDSATSREIQRAINKWAYLVSIENQTEATKQVNELLVDVITQIVSREQSQQRMEALVQFICNPAIGKEYAHYVNNVFSSVDFLPLSDILFKYRRMFASIDSDRSGGGGECAALYLRDYDSGFYDPCLPDEQDVLKWKSLLPFTQGTDTDPIDI